MPHLPKVSTPLCLLDLCYADFAFPEFSRRVSLLHALEAQSNALHHMRLQADLSFLSELIALAQLTQAHAATSPTAHVVGSRFEDCAVVNRLLSLKIGYLQDLYEFLADESAHHHYHFPAQEPYAEDDESEEDERAQTTATEGERQPSSEAVTRDLARMSVSRETGPPVASSSRLSPPKPARVTRSSKKASRKPKSPAVILSSDEN